MGEIFLARLEGVAGFEKIVVIKRVLPHLAEQDRYIAMLLDEARIVARLSHPNICQVLELGEVDGEYYIALEYLDGVTLGDLALRLSQAGTQMEPRVIVAILSQAAEGLHAAHELVDRQGRATNLVHRDVSPANVFITSVGMVKVLDFGIAKTPDRLSKTRTGAVKGKWAYMSPEQILRQPLDRRSDVFSLGIVAFELFTGRRLFRRRSEYETCRAITETDSPSMRNYRPELPSAMADVVARALARDREQRFPTVRAMGEALLAAAAPLGGACGLPEIAALVSDHFAKELDERRSFIERMDASADTAERSVDSDGALPVAPDMAPEARAIDDQFEADLDAEAEVGAAVAAVAPAGRSEPTVTDTPRGQRTGTAARRPDAPPPARAAGSASDGVAPDGVAAAPKRSGSSWMLWVGLSALLAALGVAMYLYAQRGPGAEAVARVETERGQVLVAADDAGAGDADAGAGVADGGDGADEGEEGDMADAGERSRRRRGRGRASAQNRFQREFQAEQRRISRCYNRHASALEAVPMIDVVMAVSEAGKVTRVRLQPDEYSATPLGRCLLDIVRGMRFGRQKSAAEVTIPLGVRLRRSR